MSYSLELDQTLIAESAENAESKMLYQINNLRSPGIAPRRVTRHSEVIQRHAELISNSLYPGKELPASASFAGICISLAKQCVQELGWMACWMQWHPDCLVIPPDQSEL